MCKYVCDTIDRRVLHFLVALKTKMGVLDDIASLFSPKGWAILCMILLVTTIAAWVFKMNCKPHGGMVNKVETFAPAQRYANAARYAKQPNLLMAADKSKPATTQILLPLNAGGRGDSPMDFLLPTNGVQKEVGKPAAANVADAPPVIGGTETKTEAPAEAAGVALNVTTEDAIKAGANAIATTDFHDKSIPDTSALPAVVQNGVVEEPAKEGYCGGNIRVCPQFIHNGSFAVQHKLQKGGISTNPEGFRPRRT